MCGAATGAREYANEHGLDVGDLVYVIEASEDRTVPKGWGDPEEQGWPLTVHRTWEFRVVSVDDGDCVIEEVLRG